MQLINVPSAEKVAVLERSLQKERLQRYMPAAGKDVIQSFRLYMWNCAISESFYISLHFAEIVCRNAIHKRLLDRFGADWYRNPIFQKVLDTRHLNDLMAAVSDESSQHNGGCTAHHVVSALSFGFWQHLLTKRFERLLWSNGLGSAFPGLPSNVTRDDLYRRVESIRRWRNRIAHHRAIFDKGPTRKHSEAIELIRWSCQQTGEWVSSISNVPEVISSRPKAGG